jgi:hypothetical protein
MNTRYVALRRSMLQMSSALRGPVESAVTSCCFSRRQLKLSNAAIVLGVPYKGFLNSPTPTGEVIMKSAA